MVFGNSTYMNNVHWTCRLTHFWKVAYLAFLSCLCYLWLSVPTHIIYGLKDSTNIFKWYERWMNWAQQGLLSPPPAQALQPLPHVSQPQNSPFFFSFMAFAAYPFLWGFTEYRIHSGPMRRMNWTLAFLYFHVQIVVFCVAAECVPSGEAGRHSASGTSILDKWGGLISFPAVFRLKQKYTSVYQ